MSAGQGKRRPARASRLPDMMIGVVTLALLAGFGTLLLGECNRPVVAQVPAQPSQPAIPASPGTVPEPEPVSQVPVDAGTTPEVPANASSESPEATSASSNTPSSPTGTAQAGAEGGTAGSSASATSNATAPDSVASGSSTPATSSGSAPASGSTAAAGSNSPSGSNGVAQTSTIPPVPKAPPVPPIQPPVVPEPVTQTTQTTPIQGGQAQNGQAQNGTPGTTQPTVPATQAQTPDAAAGASASRVPARSGGAVATSENRVPLRSDYRISLGSFATRKTVETQTGGVRGLGYTVHAIDLGDQYVAQIGPFADEASAQRALADIQRTYPGALLYRPRNQAASTDSDTEGSRVSESASENSASSGSSSTQASTPRQSAPAPSGPTYLQVGAFGSEERAKTLVGILHDNGFNPTVNSPEGKLTTVLVGPYAGDALLRAESRLENAGLDYFRVR